MEAINQLHPAYIAQPIAVPHDDNGLWILKQDYELDGFQVPAGFIFDGASIPRPLWSTLGILPIGYHMPASVVHDYLYRHSYSHTVLKDGVS